MRPVLTDRMLAGMVASEESLVRHEIESLRWKTDDILPPVNPRFDEQALMQQISALTCLQELWLIPLLPWDTTLSSLLRVWDINFTSINSH